MGRHFPDKVSDSRLSHFSSCTHVPGWGMVLCYHAIRVTVFHLRQASLMLSLLIVYCSLGAWTATVYNCVCKEEQMTLSCPSVSKVSSLCILPLFSSLFGVEHIYVCVCVWEHSRGRRGWPLVSTLPITLLEMWSLLNLESSKLWRSACLCLLRLQTCLIWIQALMFTNSTLSPVPIWPFQYLFFISQV